MATMSAWLTLRQKMSQFVANEVRERLPPTPSWRAGARRMSPEEFAKHFGDLPTDGEGYQVSRVRVGVRAPARLGDRSAPRRHRAP